MRESWVTDTVGEDGIFKAKVRIQNVGFGNLTWNAPVRLAVLDDLEGSDLDVCPTPTYYDLPDIDSRDIHSRTISIAGGDTVMTFDGNNEIDISTKLNIRGKGRYQVYLKIGDIQFANHEVSGIGSCGEERPAAYLGKFYYDEDIKTSIPRALTTRDSQKQNAPYVQRARNSVVVRNGEKSYRLNGAKVLKK